MSYLGASILILFLLFLTSVGWYWLFKRFERRMSERFNDISERVNENFRVNELILSRADALEAKLDLLQGVLLVIKQELALDAAMRESRAWLDKGRINSEERDDINRLLNELRLDNFSRY